MDISIKHIADPAAERCGCLVLPVADGGKFGAAAARLDQAAGGQLARLVKSEHFSGAAGKSVLLHNPSGVAAQRLLLLGCGKPGATDAAAFRKMVMHALGAVQTTGAADLVMLLDDVATNERDRDWQAQQLGLLAGAAGYRYTHTLSRPEPGSRLKKVVYSSAGCTVAEKTFDDAEATISWWLTDWLRHRYPQIRLQPHAIVAEAGNRITSGAATSHYNLGLRLIERFAGADLSLECARYTLIDTKRRSQAPYASFLQFTGHGDELVARGQAWLQEQLVQPFSLDAMARALHTSERTLMRRFRAALGDTPLHTLQRLRLHAARRLLETSSLGLEAIVEQVGYTDLSAFRRLFKREFACSPSEYRRASQGEA